MFHEDFVIFYCKYIFGLVICIAKNILITLKAIFSIFRLFLHPQIPDIQIVVYRPILTNHISMESLFVQLSDDV